MEGKIMESSTSKSTVMRNISEIFEALIIVALLLAGIVTDFFWRLTDLVMAGARLLGSAYLLHGFTLF